MNAKRAILNNNTGSVGAATLIIFISIVLIATVVASVLIYATGALQQKSLKTTKDASQEVSSNIVVVSVCGDRKNSSIPELQPGIQSIEILIKPNSGTDSIDLSQVIMTITDNDSRQDLVYSDTPDILNTYSAQAIRDDDLSFTAGVYAMNSGDLIEIRFKASDYMYLGLTPRRTLMLSLNQELGAPVNLEITAPPSFGESRYVHLYP